MLRFEGFVDILAAVVRDTWDEKVCLVKIRQVCVANGRMEVNIVKA